jgi:membrane-associated phospholipid phosphatase
MCATMVTVATATGVLRILGDDHYMTDVIAGGALGFLVGYSLPKLLHYTTLSPNIASAHLHMMIVPRVTSLETGVGAVGWF